MSNFSLWRFHLIQCLLLILILLKNYSNTYYNNKDYSGLLQDVKRYHIRGERQGSTSSTVRDLSHQLNEGFGGCKGGILLNLCNRIFGRDRPGLLDIKGGGREI